MFEKLKQLVIANIPEKSITSNALRIYLLQFTNIFFGLAAGIIIARVLGPEQKGTVDLVNVVSAFVNEIGVFGIGYGLLYYLTNKQEPVENIHGSALVYSLAIGTITGFLGIIGLPLWRSLIPGLQDWMLLIPFIISPITFYVNIWPFIMIGTDRAVTAYRIWLIVSICSFTISTILWISGVLDVTLILLISAVINLINALIALLLLKRKNRRIKFSLNLTKQSISYGFIIFIGSFANIIHFKVDQLMINSWLGSSAVGIYALSVFWAEKLFILDGAINSASLYKIGSASSKESSNLTMKVSKIQLFISCLGGLLLASIAYPLITFFYGDVYKDAIIPLILLIPGIIAWSISKIFSVNLSYNKGLGSLVTKIALLGCVINILLNYIVLEILKFGIIGTSIASSLSYCFVAYLTISRSRILIKEDLITPNLLKH